MLNISAHYAVTRCLSVCLSHAGIVSKRLNILEHFSPSDSSNILLIRHKRYANIPTSTCTLTRASNALQGYETITIFDQYLALSRK